MKLWLNILIIICISFTASFSLLKAEDKPLTEIQEFDLKVFYKTSYRDFLDIKIFDKQFTGVLFVNGVGGNEEKIGLNKNELSDYLRLSIKNNFTNIKLEEPDFNIYTEDQVGTIRFRIWVIGDNDFPIAYHLKCTFYNEYKADLYDDLSIQIWVRERLGFTTKDKVEERIKRSINNMIEELAILFYEVRGEL